MEVSFRCVFSLFYEVVAFSFRIRLESFVHVGDVVVVTSEEELTEQRKAREGRNKKRKEGIYEGQTGRMESSAVGLG